MTGKDLFGTLVRWTALVWILSSIASFLLLHWLDSLLMIAAGVGLLTFADDVVEFSYRSRPSFRSYFHHRTDPTDTPSQETKSSN
jgi:hypothetical protein